MADEIAKAIQETAKAVTATVENIDKVDRVAGRLLGPVGQLWGLLTDLAQEQRFRMIAEQRIKNRAKILMLAQQKIEELELEGISLIPLPPRFSSQYLVGMETEDEPTIQELWANLLVNATRGDTARIDPQKSFGRILADMEPDDASFFEAFARRPNISQFWYSGLKPPDTSILHYDLRPFAKGLDDEGSCFPKFVEDEREVQFIGWLPSRTLQAIDRLRRISLIEYSFGTEDEIKRMLERALERNESDVKITQLPGGGISLEGPSASIESRTRSVIKYRVTSLGQAFFNAIRHPVSPS
jgi:hypothetical protein